LTDCRDLDYCAFLFNSNKDPLGFLELLYYIIVYYLLNYLTSHPISELLISLLLVSIPFPSDVKTSENIQR